MELPPEAPEPRLCHLVKWADFDGYGFNLHAEKTKSGQYIGKVDEASPAKLAGLQEGDRIVEVNGVNITNENHRQVVERIKAMPNETKLLVIDEEGDKWYKEKKLVIKSTQDNVRMIKTPSSPLAINEEISKSESDYTNHSTPEPSATVEDLHEVVKENNNVPNIKDEKVEKSPIFIHNNNNNNETDKDVLDMKATELVNGASSSRSSTPQTIPEDETKQEISPIPVEGPVSMSPDMTVTSGGSSLGSRGSTASNSIPASPTSNKSASSNGITSSAVTDLNLNMSVSQMREMLAQKKKNDPKKAQMDLRQKYEIIQQM